jgi:hypothetical protein
MPADARPRRTPRRPAPPAAELLRDLLAALRRDPDPAVRAWAGQFGRPAPADLPTPTGK